jgi:dTDP-4-amino-4,6-dideoxygalactose transaminase
VQAVRTLRQYGWSTKYHVSTPQGRNSRLDEIQAAVLRTKLPHLDAANAQRRAIAARYSAALAGLPLQLPPSTQEDYVGHLYVVRTNARDAFREHLRASNVATDVHYPVPDHRQAAYPDAQAAGPLTHTEQACDTVLSLPCFPGLPDADVDRVIAAVRAFFAR